MKMSVSLQPAPFFVSLASFAFFVLWSLALYFGAYMVCELMIADVPFGPQHVLFGGLALIGGQAVLRYIVTFFVYQKRVADMKEHMPLKIERTYRKPLKLTVLLGISSGSVQLDNKFVHTPLFQGFIGLQIVNKIQATGPVITYTTPKSPEDSLVISLLPAPLR
jgi:hypothetical protein